MKKKSLIIGMFWFVVLLLGSPALAENLVIAGTGDSQFILQKLAVLFEVQNPGTTIEVPDSIGSGGGIKQISQYKIGLARTARPLKEKEKKKSLTEIVFARSPVVFVAGPGVTVNNVSSQQVLDIFAGKLTNWKTLGGPDNKIYPIDRELGDSSRKVVADNLPGFKDIQSVGKVYYTTPETAKAIGKHKFTFGFVPLSVALANNLHVLSLDDHAATGDNAKSGKYILLTSFYLIQSDQSGPLAQRFIDFVFTPEARELMAGNGLIPVGSP